MNGTLSSKNKITHSYKLENVQSNHPQNTIYKYVNL